MICNIKPHLVEFRSGVVDVADPAGSQGGGEGNVQHVPGPHQAVQLGQLQEVDWRVRLDRQRLLLSLHTARLYLNLRDSSIMSQGKAGVYFVKYFSPGEGEIIERGEKKGKKKSENGTK